MYRDLESKVSAKLPVVLVSCWLKSFYGCLRTRVQGLVRERKGSTTNSVLDSCASFSISTIRYLKLGQPLLRTVICVLLHVP